MKEINLSQEEVIKQMDAKIYMGWSCFIKWTCESCGERVTCSTPNGFFTKGYTHDECGHTSHPKVFGILVMQSLDNDNEREKKE